VFRRTCPCFLFCFSHSSTALKLTFYQSHSVRHTKVSRSPLDEGSARRRNITHNTHKRHISMTPARFEPAIPASRRLFLQNSRLLGSTLNLSTGTQKWYLTKSSDLEGLLTFSPPLPPRCRYLPQRTILEHPQFERPNWRAYISKATGGKILCQLEPI
jgi:hypothetical protein